MRPVCCISILMLACPHLRAESTPEGTLETAAITNAIGYLRGVAAADPDGWFAPPVRQRTVVNTKEITVYMKKVEVDVPVWEYETMKVFRNVKQGQSIDAVAVRKEVEERRPVRQIGTQKQTKLVPDPKGDIKVQQKIPEYGPGGPDFWKAYHFGHNAMVLYALMSAGIGREDRLVSQPLESLASLFDRYGLPDTTWDLAWTAAAFSMAGKTSDRCKSIAVQAASKLIDGQIDSGPAMGLWGPVCLNLKLVAALEASRPRLANNFVQAQADVDAKRKNAETRLDAARAALKELDRELRNNMMYRSLNYRQIEMQQRLTDDIEATIEVSGLPQYPYNQVAADMENTAMALFGLTAAAANGALPAETARPKMKDIRLPAGLNSAQVLLRTASVLTRAQRTDGSFTELNLHQPHAEFAASAKVIPGIPAAAASFVPLDSKTTFTSSAQGYASLLYLRRILGASAAPLAKSVAAAETFLKGRLAELAPAGFAEENGGQVAPYDALFALHLAHSFSPGSLTPETWKQTVEFIEGSQAADGSWTQIGSGYMGKSRAGSAGDDDWMIFSCHRERASKTESIMNPPDAKAPPAKAPPAKAPAVQPAKGGKMPDARPHAADGDKKAGNPPVDQKDLIFGLAHVYASLDDNKWRGWYLKNYSYNSHVVATGFALAALLHPNTTAPAEPPAPGSSNPALPAQQSKGPVAK